MGLFVWADLSAEAFTAPGRMVASDPSGLDAWRALYT